MSSTPTYPTEITLETLPQLFAAHRAKWGGMTMTAATPEPDPDAQDPKDADQDADQRPSGVSEEEWNALGDSGQKAIRRERAARQEAERQLAASRARPTAPKKAAESKTTESKTTESKTDAKADELDIASIVEQAVQAATKPFIEREEQRAADDAASKIVDAVIEEAKSLLHDPTDAITGIDLAQVTDGNGAADVAKIRAQLDGLVQRKPHLAKTDGRRTAPAGGAAGAGQPSQPLETRVQSTLARMQSAAGIRPTT